jgi:hypothetical protein
MKPFMPNAFEKTVNIYKQMLQVGVSPDAVHKAMKLKNIDKSVIFEVLGNSVAFSVFSPTSAISATSVTASKPTIVCTPNQPPDTTHDSIVQAVVQKFQQRSAVGISKYGTTLDRSDLTPSEWIQHAQEELMDGILYLEKLKTYL